MRWVLKHAADVRLSAIPCDVDPNWIIRYLQSRAELPAFEVVKHGNSSSYSDMPRYRVRRGHRLTTEDVALGRPGELDVAVKAWRELGTGYGQLPPAQVSVPSPLDLALFTVGAARALRTYPVFERMITSEVVDIARRHDQNVVFQLESPAVLHLMHRTPVAAQPAAARLLARQLARIITSAPHTARWTLHLCYGDLGHKALVTPRGLRPAVLVINALAAFLLAAERPIPAVHIPMAFGDQPPPATASAYLALRDLSRGIPVIAGCVDERHPDLSARALRHTENALDQRVAGVAAACGYGRRTPTEAQLNLELACQLATTG
jgi:hypothetical protein